MASTTEIKCDRCDFTIVQDNRADNEEAWTGENQMPFYQGAGTYLGKHDWCHDCYVKLEELRDRMDLQVKYYKEEFLGMLNPVKIVPLGKAEEAEIVKMRMAREAKKR